MNHKIELSAETLRRMGFNARQAMIAAGVRSDAEMAARHKQDAQEIDALLDGQAREECCVVRQEDSEFGTWDFRCGITWIFQDAGPVENGMRFCPGCGKPVKIKERDDA